MGRSRHFRLAVSIAASSALAAWLAACSGSDDAEPLDPTPDASLPEASAPDTSTPDTSAPDTGPKDSGPQYDAGPPTVLDGGDLYEGGVPCVVGGQLEEEPNDDTTTANTLAPTRCGVVFPLDPDAGADAAADAGDAGATESDFLTFTLKPTTTSFFLQFSGNITMTVSVEGKQPVTISQTQSPAVPFVKDKPYYVEVKSANGKRQAWRVTLFEN